jgi:hypothetical protein
VAGVGAAALSCALFGSLFAVWAQARPNHAILRLAQRVAARDPGAALAGSTIIGTTKGAFLVGSAHRPNAIVALARDEKIIGGATSNDELAARAAGVTIVAGGGTDQIYGARRSTVLGGSGQDLITDRRPGATVRVTSRRGSVVAFSGRRDRVFCSSGARHIVIYDDPTTVISSSCRAAHARVLPVSLFNSPGSSRSAVRADGNGTRDRPYVAPCDVQGVDPCPVTGFAIRHCCGGWTKWEHVPAYKCPPDRPYLFNSRTERQPAIVPNGVSILESNEGIWPIGIALNKTLSNHREIGGVKPRYALGIWADPRSITPNTATQWSWENGHWYKVQLLCTGDANRGYIPIQ